MSKRHYVAAFGLCAALVTPRLVAQPCSPATLEILYPTAAAQQGCWPTGGPSGGCPRPPGLGVNPIRVLQPTVVTASLCTVPSTPVVWLLGTQAIDLPLPTITVPRTGESCSLNLVPTAIIPGNSTTAPFGAGSISLLSLPAVGVSACGATLRLQLAALEPSFNPAGISITSRVDFTIGI